MSEVDTSAKLIWDYMLLHQEPQQADAIVILGSNDVRVADRGVELFKANLAPVIVCTGNRGRGTDFIKTEARTFAERAIELSIPREKILLEERATNTGENATFTRELLAHEGINAKAVIVVTKPYMERRAYATFAKQWPEVTTYIASPRLDYESYFLDEEFKKESISMMVADLERIRRYASEGFQIPQEIPVDVWSAYESLIRLGYGKYV